MRIVVTGAGGFIGWHLVEALAHRGDTVQAWLRRPGPPGWGAGVETAVVDIVDPAAVGRALTAFAPDAIVHLAAQSFPGRSWEEPALTYRVNVGGLIHLLEAIRILAPPVRLMLAGSSAEYAEAVAGMPISEEAETDPNSPYGGSKLAADQLARLYVRQYNLDIVRFRPFFLAGPRKTGDVCSDFARRIVAVERGQASSVRVGTLDVVRDLMDVRDGVGGLLRIMQSGKSGEVYNICAGIGVSMHQVLEGYRTLASAPVTVVQDPLLVRPWEQRVRIGDATRLRALGWEPQYTLPDTLRSILEYWRAVPQ